MDIESPNWEHWEAEFTALADKAEKVDVTPQIKNARHYLCLYGDNGLLPDEEMAELEAMAADPSRVKKVEIDTSFWQDTVLFVPS